MEDLQVSETQPAPRPARKKRSAWLPVTMGVILLAAAYKILVAVEFEQTSALFIGLPTLLGLTLVCLPSGQLYTLNALRGILVFTAVAWLVLGEGLACIWMFIPLLGGVVLFICGIQDCVNYANRRRPRKKVGKNRSGLVVAVPFLLMSLEGVTEDLSFQRHEVVVVERLVQGTPSEVEARLAGVPRLPAELPSYLALGFPMPVEVRGGGVEPGDELRVHFAGGEGKPGDLDLVVTRRTEDSVTWGVVSDTSHVSHWLAWQESRVEWEDAANGQTLVRWTLSYERLLDPAWWFGPWERHAAGLTGEMLIEHMASPEEGH